jgi:hypothetical protein
MCRGGIIDRVLLVQRIHSPIHGRRINQCHFFVIGVWGFGWVIWLGFCAKIIEANLWKNTGKIV